MNIGPNLSDEEKRFYNTDARTIQLPQQPIPVLHTLSNTPQFKPMPTVHTTTSNGQLSMLATNVSSFIPNFGATTVATHQRAYVQQPSNEIYVQSLPTSVSTTTNLQSSNLTTSTYLPMSSVPSVSLDNDLSCPPDEIFDSEDGDATSNENDSESVTTSAVKSLPTISSTTDKNNDVENNDVDGGTDINALFDSYVDPEQMESTDNCQTSLNLPTNRPRGVLQEIPRGWVRKLVTTGKGPRVFYYNTMGKKFSSAEEISQYFLRLGQSVKPGLFNFEPSKCNEDGSVNNFLNGKSNSEPLESRSQSQSQSMQIVSN
jgi:hypothetical protein